jgi:protein-tyrosine phosphatase
MVWNSLIEMYKFAPVLPIESTQLLSHQQNIFGCARPGYSDRAVEKWLEFIDRQNIEQICCLLTARQLERYNTNLLDRYHQKFGEDRVCWTPIRDFNLCELSMLKGQILPFLATAERLDQKVVVHCSGGIGRTGHILAAWLVYKYQYSNREAISTVIKMGRNPYEAALFGVFRGKNIVTGIQELNLLLDCCRSI